MLRRLLRKAARRLEDALAVDPPRATKTATDGSPADRDESLAATVERARARMREEEPAAVLVYATAKDRAAVDTIRDVFAKYGETIREVDLDRDPRHFRNIAASTGVMVPPYVFVHGRHIGSDQEVAALDAENELAKILAGRLDELGPEARRMLKLRESFSDEVSLENLRDRLARGHSLSVDGIDTWLEQGEDGPVLFHMGRPHRGDDVERILTSIVEDAAAERIEVRFHVDPDVRIGGP